MRVQEYLDSIHENEHRRVNRFLKGLGKDVSKPFTVKHAETINIFIHRWFFPPLVPGNKMKFLSKK